MNTQHKTTEAGGSAGIYHAYFVRVAIAIILAVVAVTVSFFFKPSRSDAQATVLSPFGGRIILTQYCCDGSILVSLGPPAIPPNDMYIYSPEITHLYSDYNAFAPGPWQLGLAVPTGSCTLSVGGCETSYEAPTMLIDGTSAE